LRKSRPNKTAVVALADQPPRQRFNRLVPAVVLFEIIGLATLLLCLLGGFIQFTKYTSGNSLFLNNI